MPDGQLIEFAHLTKHFGAVAAVSDFSARVEPGVVTGFLGPNGAGKTTTLRMLLGLVRPTSGTATIGGTAYADLKHPLQTVGAALEASSFHPGRSGAAHLKIYAQAAGLPTSRVDEVLGIVGLSDVAGRKVGGYSLGMRQRLGLATALLGDPGVVVLDEPANGLDPEGIRWMRTFLRQLAREGRTVLTSSHLLAEVQQTAQALLIIAQGRLVFAGGIHELSAQEESAVVVDSPDRAALVEALRAAGVPFEVLRAGLTVRAADTTQIGAVAAAAGVALSGLQKRGPALEEIFLELVNGLRVHPSAAGIAGTLEAGNGDGVESQTPAAEPGTPAAEPESSVAEQRAVVTEETTMDAAAHADGPDAADATPVAEPVSEDTATDEAVTAEAATEPDADTPLAEEPAVVEEDRPLPGVADLAAAAAGIAPASGVSAVAQDGDATETHSEATDTADEPDIAGSYVDAEAPDAQPEAAPTAAAADAEPGDEPGSYTDAQPEHAASEPVADGDEPGSYVDAQTQAASESDSTIISDETEQPGEYVDVDSEGEDAQSSSAATAPQSESDQPGSETAVWAVATTGVIDTVPGSAATEDAAPAAESDSDAADSDDGSATDAFFSAFEEDDGRQDEGQQDESPRDEEGEQR